MSKQRKRKSIHFHNTYTYTNRIPLVVFALMAIVIGALAITLFASRVTIHKLRAQAAAHTPENGWIPLEPYPSGADLPPGPPQHQVNCLKGAQ